MFQISFGELSPQQIASIAEEKLSSPISAWEQTIWAFLQQWFSETETIAVFTSGSTGTPKEIKHRKEHMRYSAQLTCAALHLKKNDTALLCLPANKISGIMMLVRSIEHQLNLTCVEPSATPLLHLSAEAAIDFAAFTPMQFSSILSSETALSNAGRISHIILGGESISEPLLQKIRSMKNEVYATFGMTETISHIALKKLSGPTLDKYYHTLPGITVEANEQQHLVIHAPLLGQPHLVTNDEVRIVSPSEFEWLGRTDNVINSGGIKIHSEAIEVELRKQTNASFFITALPDIKTGQQVAIALEQTEISEREIADWKNLFSKLDKLWQPKQILLIPKFERTENGKVNRKRCMENFMQAENTNPVIRIY